jgi:uncharacterized protein DUF1942
VAQAVAVLVAPNELTPSLESSTKALGENCSDIELVDERPGSRHALANIRFEIPSFGYTFDLAAALGQPAHHEGSPDVAFSHIASKTAAATTVLAAAGILVATPAFADPQVLQFGQMAEISSMGGTIDYTVSNLQPSGHNDGVWYSDVTAKGVSGNATPNIADFNARAVNSSTFAVMKGNQTDGLPEGPLPLGSPVTGRVYFDVRNGTNPDSVVYLDAGGTDKVVWKGQ